MPRVSCADDRPALRVTPSTGHSSPVARKRLLRKDLDWGKIDFSRALFPGFGRMSGPPSRRALSCLGSSELSSSSTICCESGVVSIRAAALWCSAVATPRYAALRKARVQFAASHADAAAGSTHRRAPILMTGMPLSVKRYTVLRLTPRTAANSSSVNSFAQTVARRASNLAVCSIRVAHLR
jgi:hypothetical protein